MVHSTIYIINDGQTLDPIHDIYPPVQELAVWYTMIEFNVSEEIARRLISEVHIQGSEVAVIYKPDEKLQGLF